MHPHHELNYYVKQMIKKNAKNSDSYLCLISKFSDGVALLSDQCQSRFRKFGENR